MVESKRLFSPFMMLHILLVFIPAFVASGIWQIALIISVTHWLTDAMKVAMLNKIPQKGYLLFILDQCAHLLVIFLVWGFHYNFLVSLPEIITIPFFNVNYNLVFLGYAIVTWPLGYLLKFTLVKVTPPGGNKQSEEGSKLIGRFERIIVLSFVLVHHYEAIGLLLIAKGIIYNAEKDKISGKNVLVGTMMSYSITVIVGLIINFLLQ